jgi:hypothetical protein
VVPSFCFCVSRWQTRGVAVRLVETLGPYGRRNSREGLPQAAEKSSELKRAANLGLSAKLPRDEPRPENLPQEKQVREQRAEMDRGIEIVD